MAASSAPLRASPISETGITNALCDKGDNRDIFQVPLADFPDPKRLTEQTVYIFTSGTLSSTPYIVAANSGGTSTIEANALGASTVVLANEFTHMIVTQRAFSPNTKIITTTDEMLAELTNIH